MEIKLSILIPTTLPRFEMTAKLVSKIDEQRKELPVELLLDWHKTNCVGVKRNDLLKQAKGEYVVHVDSDDHIADNYVELILKAIESKPDCVGICGHITTNGSNKMDWFISKEYGNWKQVGNVYYRTPNHISPIRREHALKAMFPEIPFGEDYGFSMAVLPYLKTETIIEQPIYHYDFYEQK